MLRKNSLVWPPVLALSHPEQGGTSHVPRPGPGQAGADRMDSRMVDVINDAD